MLDAFNINIRHLGVYPQDCFCEVTANGRKYSFKMISLFTAGVRLTCAEHATPNEMDDWDEVWVNLKILSKGVESGAFPCRVEYTEGRELFLKFSTALAFSFIDVVKENQQYFY